MRGAREDAALGPAEMFWDRDSLLWLRGHRVCRRAVLMATTLLPLVALLVDGVSRAEATTVHRRALPGK